MKPKEAIELLRGGSSHEWNAYRNRVSTWIPDLTGLDLSTCDLVPDHKPPFNLAGAILIGTIMPSLDRVKAHGNQAILEGCKFDATTTFASKPYDLASFGGILVTSEGIEIPWTRLFVSYAHSELHTVDKYITELEQLGLRIAWDKKNFTAGQLLDSEISKAMHPSDVIVIFYSASSQNREWTNFERRLASKLEADANGDQQQAPMILYVCLDRTKLPEDQNHRIAIYADQRDPSEVCQEINANIQRRAQVNPITKSLKPSIDSIPDHDRRKLKKRIANYMISVRNRMPRVQVDSSIPKAYEYWPDNLKGNPTTRLIVYLRSSGCRWAISSKNGQINLRTGCLDCEHSLSGSTFGKYISSSNYLKQFQHAISDVDFSATPVVCVYNEGNFFNTSELPKDARISILEKIASIPEIRSVIVESLPEYLDEGCLVEMGQILGNRDIEIGIGLESSNQIVRDLCVNKSYTLEKFKSTVEVIRKHAKVLAYVLLKPSFLSEREALDDAITTAKYAFENGVDIVSIEPINISEFNMSGELNRIQQYRPCWLWTIIEAVRQSSKYGTVRLGGEQFAPKYAHHPYNCGKCNQKFYRAFQDYNRTLDLNILSSVTCDCHSAWLKSIEEVTRPLIERIEICLDLLETSGGINREEEGGWV